MGKSIILFQDVSRRDILYPMRGALVVALALTLWSCVPGHGGKYPLVEKYNWEGKIDGRRENNLPQQKGTEPLIASRSGGARGRRINFGSEVEHYSRPYMVNLFGCGGSILSKKIVLTAAHCVVDMKKCSLEERVCENIEHKNWEVVTGDHDMSKTEKDEQKILVQSVYIHPKWPDRNFDSKCPSHAGKTFDLAILKLAEDIRFDKASQPIQIFKSKSETISRGPCLTPKITEFNNETRFLVTGWGWGLGMNGESKDGNILNEASVQNNPECVGHRCGASTGIDQSEMCTDGPVTGAAGACPGDSGGPLTWFDEDDSELKLVGVVSRGNGCPKNKTVAKYTIYPRLSHPDALDWINKIMNDNCIPYSIEACKKAAKMNDLEIGSDRFPFVGEDYAEEGCYSYKTGNSKGHVFYGTGGTDAQMGKEATGRRYRPRGYDCGDDEQKSDKKKSNEKKSNEQNTQEEKSAKKKSDEKNFDRGFRKMSLTQVLPQMQ